MKSSMRKTLLVTLSLCSMQMLHAQSPCSSTLAQEYAALMALYQSTNGAAWTHNTGWRDANPNVVQSVVGWYGVETDAAGHVIGLDMPVNNLHGQIPQELGNLSCLQSLSFFANPIGGTIPSSLGNLSALKTLGLLQNQLTGSIPASLGNLANLTTLNLHANQLTGSIPPELGNLSALTTLQLSHNSLTGPIPASIGNLSNLQYLTLYDGELTGPLPTSLGNLDNLKYLGLANNHITGSIPSEYGNMSHLIEFDVHINALTGSIPAALGSLNNLEILNLSTNQLSGGIPDQLGSLSNLKTLDLSANQLTGTIPATIGNLIGLTRLFLYNNQLSGSIPSELGNLIHLNYLMLYTNQLTGILPSSMGNLTSMIQLWLNDNHLSGALPPGLGNLVNLTHLILHTNQFSGSIPASFGNLINLDQLWLNGNSLSGAIPSELGNLVNATYLILSLNQLSGSIPPSLGGMTKVQILQLTGNQLTGSIPSTLGNLAYLETLRLHDNLLSGPIPTTFSNLTRLRILQLTNNRLVGTLNATIASIPQLQEVYVDNNALTFENLIGFKQVYAHSFTYAPQSQVDLETTVTAAIGTSLTLTTSIDRSTTPASSYQWFKVVNGTTSALNTPATEGHTVVIPAIAQADAGTQFFYKITNTAAPELTLTSKLQTLQIVTCTTPTLDFQSDELDGTHTFTPSITGENCTATYTWDFGDGTTSSEQAPQHAYTSTGTFTVTLNVSSTCGTCPVTELTQQHNVTIAGSSLCASIFCDGAGGVGIGTQKTEGFRLSVNGKIRASDIIKVYPQTQWSDFVFDKGYKLRPLKEVESFIKTNGHLPEIPSAKEVAKEGIDLGAMDAKLLQKVEELTLYVIELKKENELMKKEIQSLSSKKRRNK
jgi:Leucine-rich repeat (LRR) protein